MPRPHPSAGPDQPNEHDGHPPFVQPSMLGGAAGGRDHLGALRVGPSVLASGSEIGPLAGISMVVKDLVDVAGVATGAGNPQFLADAVPASTHAPAVERLLRAGASVVGKAHSDELAFSLSGTNVHYGTPLNMAAPGRVPGGSSSGSASAVAGGLVPLAIGTDTGGSIRVPAAYCGIFGFRPTHGRVPLTGVVELAASFGTVGLLAATGRVLEPAGLALLDEPVTMPGRRAHAASALVVAEDLMDEADTAVTSAVTEAAGALAGALAIPLLRANVTGGALDAWFSAFRNRQMVEAWRRHGPWIRRRRPDLGPGIAARFEEASRTPPEAATAADAVKLAVRRQIERVLPSGALLVLPSAATVAPPLQCAPSTKDDLRRRTLRLTCLAGLGGLPALSLPAGQVGTLPVGLCLVGRVNDDAILLDVAGRSGQAPSTRARMPDRR